GGNLRSRCGAPGLLQHADQLLVDELLDAVSAELPAEARSLDAAEWQFGTVGADSVDVDHPRIEAVRHPEGLFRIVGKDVRTESERRVVRQFDRLLLGA